MVPLVRRRLTLRLALVFFAIVLAAVGVVYFYVVPQLESRLREQKLESLSTDARRYSAPIARAIAEQRSASALDRAVRQAADRANARVTLLGIPANREVSPPFVFSDSSAEVEIADLQFQIAEDAVATRRTVTGGESSAEGSLGQAARPLAFAGKVTHVVVYSAPLADVQDNVALIRRQILVAGALALLISVLAGYLVARALTLRVRRIERAAEKVARGDFSQSIPVDSEDELGQLAQAFNDMQRQLARLDQARKQFIAIASHELRTPLFSLGGFVELLEDEDLDEATRAEFVSQIRQQLDRLTRLATELLDLSRLEAGSLELHPEQVDVAELTRAVAAEFTPAAAQHRSRLRVSAPDDMEARCDPARVAQIIRILMDNALTHTPDGTDIAVTAVRENGRVRLAVRDTGPGIRRRAIGHIFEPFYTDDDAQGAGLGLAIARELAERMEGRLDVESHRGATVFTLELPA